MAKTTILEQDLTSASTTQLNNNVVYIPGYAVMGPINQPTLCNSLAEFQNMFGKLPYKFKTTQSLNGTTYAKKDDYEKSYWYAADLLNLGLPVLFERVGTDLTKTAKATLNIYKKVGILNAETPASYTINLDVTKIEADDDDVQNFKYTDKDNATIAILSKIRDRLSDENSTLTIGDDKTIKITTLTLGDKGDIRVSLEEGYDLVNASESINLNISVIPQTYQLRVTFDESGNQPGFSYNIYNISNNEYIKVDNLADIKHNLTDNTISTYVYNIKSTGEQIIFSGTLMIENSDELANSKLVIWAKHPGSYGNNITCDVETIEGEEISSGIRETFIKLTNKLTLNNVESSDSAIISLDETNKDKFYKNIESNLVVFECDIIDEASEETNISQALIHSGFYHIKNTSMPLNNDQDQRTDEFNVESFYKKLNGDETESIFKKLEDRDEYDIKFITSGSYPVLDSMYISIYRIMLETAANRGDCVALLDHIDEDVMLMFNNLKTTLTTKVLSANGEDAKKYGAVFSPWAKYKLQTANEIVSYPGSFAYLRCIATSTKTNANWFATSGVTRGQVPNIVSLNQSLTGAIADQLQSRSGISVNPIVNIRPYGYCVWGNRTLFNNIGDLTASSFLNIRMLSNDVKKKVYSTTKKLTFELNSDVLWLNFKADVTPLLDKMVSGNGLSNYKLIKLNTTKKATVACKIKLFAVEAVEDWDITVELADSYTSIQ